LLRKAADSIGWSERKPAGAKGQWRGKARLLVVADHRRLVRLYVRINP